MVLKPQTEKEITRRKFLGGLGIGIASSSLGARVLIENSGKDDPVPLRYEGLYDYRDICIASGIAQLESVATEPTRVVLIHGVKHSRGIQYYLENPSIAKEKYRLLYKDFAVLAPPKINAYKFELTPNEVRVDKDNNVWAESLGEWKNTLKIDTRI